MTGISSLVMLALSLYVFFTYRFSGEQFQGVLAWTWMQNVGLLGEKGIQFKVGVDGIGASLVLLTGVVVVPVRSNNCGCNRYLVNACGVACAGLRVWAAGWDGPLPHHDAAARV